MLTYTTISSILSSKTLGSISAFFNVDQMICTLKVSCLFIFPLVSLHLLLKYYDPDSFILSKLFEL